MASITGENAGDGEGDPTTITGEPISSNPTGDFTENRPSSQGDPNASAGGIPRGTTEDSGVPPNDVAAPAKESTQETDALLRNTTPTTPDQPAQSVGASETQHDGGASLLALITRSTAEGGDEDATVEGLDGGENLKKAKTGLDGGNSKERKGVETMPKEGNAMEHLIKDLEELSPVATPHEGKPSKISESSKELSKTMDMWVNGKGVKASNDGGGEKDKEFTISPSRFSPLQDIDEEEESGLEGSGTEVEVEDVKYRGIIVDGKKEKELQEASTSRQQGSVPRQLRGRVTGSKDMSRGGHGGSNRSSKKTSGRKL
ncbi:hypothetical protein HID58_070043 [Brassica napus]|uniref:Uncharacterized protein n=1 Tax=Brassica napus TaxID=3708 RepID=A0ABQ7YXM6_BRANA|nr:hypothetical protein HID58_070043 [Brassica napus]